ncbi:histidine--tRNA ligase [Saccharibacillus sp. CPCC 101409]|uniref:histidine--tRNA ligase n=1 Tax=Saccharibacillus sp. CPCC 101409 TaxID=3058041 RepID=UPI002673D53E|nr:histidine--tRNA ligase [Saccharibacillus sp. CPCC 101409]MDO3409804.1 histidine--tRNA ligase [Saccharibacillus sp. CPCC 101409]
MQNVKGTYDFFGKRQAVRKQAQSTLEQVFELYDFDGMDSTILNELDLLTSKYAGGEEILKEMYRLTDQGERRLGLRYDLTIPFAKVVALNPGIELPLRRYEIGKVFRDGPVKKGRLREFLQCDADVVGIAGPEAEAELMQLAAEVFRRLDLPVVLRWNNRRFMGEWLKALGVPAGDALSVMLTLDKVEKIGPDSAARELLDKGIVPDAVRSILDLLGDDGFTFEKAADVCGLGETPGMLEVRSLQSLIRELGLEQICRFDPFLSRGLSFYTGTVYEIFDASNAFTSSLGGGGRYDAIIGQLIGREDLAYPTVGISFGMESIIELLEARRIKTPDASAIVLPIGDVSGPALRTAQALRAAGIRTSLGGSGRKLKKALAAASARGIRYAVLIGEDEAALGQVRIKDMERQMENSLPLEEAAAYIRAGIENAESPASANI